MWSWKCADHPPGLVGPRVNSSRHALGKIRDPNPKTPSKITTKVVKELGAWTEVVKKGTNVATISHQQTQKQLKSNNKNP